MPKHLAEALQYRASRTSYLGGVSAGSDTASMLAYGSTISSWLLEPDRFGDYNRQAVGLGELQNGGDQVQEQEDDIARFCIAVTD